MESVISSISCETPFVESWKMILAMIFILLISILLYYPIKDLYLVYIKGIPPGPISLPLIGSLHLMSPHTPHLSVGKLYKKYGPIVSLRMGPFGRAVFVSDLQLIDEVFTKTDISDRPKLPFIEIINNGADGIGSCPCGSEKWRYLVRVLQQGQAKFSNNNLYEQIHPYLEILIERFAEKGHGGYDPRGDIVKTCSAIFSSIVYGIKTESLESADLKSRMVYHNTVMSCLNPSHFLNILPSIWLIPSSLKRTIKACIQHRESQMAEQLQGHIEQIDDNNLKDMMDIAAQCVTQYPSIMKNKGATTKDLLISIWTFYLAGCETTVDTMLWILLYISINPGIQRRIQQELDAVLTNTDENVLEKKSSLHYTRATVLECLRLSSPVAMGIPRSSATDVTLGGYFIPKDTLVMLTQWTIHHDEKYWPEPFELKPERFLHSDGSLLSLNYIFKKMPYIPFSRGMRPCLGQYMALDILLIFVCNTLRQYDLKLTEEKLPDLTGKVVLNLRPHEIPFIFQKRQEKDKSANDLL